MTYPELYVLRHGETTWNAEGRMQGALNSPLTAKGEAQALQQRRILETCDLTGFRFYSSSQGRAFQTAGLALAGCADSIRTDDRLREIGVGEWAGRWRADLMAEAGIEEPEGPDGNLSLYETAPAGEGFDALEARCRSFLADIDGPSVLVTHGITSRMLRSIVLDLGRDGMVSLPGGQGNVFHLKDGMQKELT